MPESDDQEPELSQGMQLVLSFAWESAQNSEKPMVELPHILHAIYALPESYAAYYMLLQGVEEVDLLQEMTIAYEDPSYKKTTEKKPPNNIRYRNPAYRELLPHGTIREQTATSFQTLRRMPCRNHLKTKRKTTAPTLTAASDSNTPPA